MRDNGTVDPVFGSFSDASDLRDYYFDLKGGVIRPFFFPLGMLYY